MRSTEAERQHLNTFMIDIAGQLEQCEIALSENQQEMIARLATKYVDALEQSIRKRFPTEIINKLEAFHIFDAGMVPEEESEEFEVFGNKEVQIFKNHYYKDNIEKADGLGNQWDDFKYEMGTLDNMWISFKPQLKNNEIELKITSRESSLKQMVKKYAEMDQFKEITFLAQVSLIERVRNDWSERGASQVKRVKSRTRSTMKNELHNALLNISINGPAYNSKEAK